MVLAFSNRTVLQETTELTPRWQRFQGGRALAHVGYRRRLMRIAVGVTTATCLGAAVAFGDAATITSTLAPLFRSAAMSANAVAAFAGRLVALPPSDDFKSSGANEAEQRASEIAPMATARPTSTPAFVPTAIPTADATKPIVQSTPLVVMTATPRATVVPTRAPAASVTPVSLANVSGQSTHTVASGDSLWQVANRYNTTVDAIVRANRLADPNVLAPGDRLVIPR